MLHLLSDLIIHFVYNQPVSLGGAVQRETCIQVAWSTMEVKGEAQINALFCAHTVCRPIAHNCWWLFQF